MPVTTLRDVDVGVLQHPQINLHGCTATATEIELKVQGKRLLFAFTVYTYTAEMLFHLVLEFDLTVKHVLVMDGLTTVVAIITYLSIAMTIFFEYTTVS